MIFLFFVSFNPTFLKTDDTKKSETADERIGNNLSLITYYLTH